MKSQYQLERGEKAAVTAATLSFLLSFLLLRLGGFSASAAVNFENYLIKSMIVSTAGMTTLQAISFAAGPFLPLLASLLLLAFGLSLLIYCGYRKDSQAGKISGVVGAALALVFFPTALGLFLAAAVFFSAYLSVKLSNAYGREARRWARFRVGSNASGKALFVFNIIVSAGVFFAVLASQPAYEASFRQELTDAMKSIAFSLPGASLLPPDVLSQRIESAISSSSLFAAYIRWLPVTTAFGTWVMLELLRNVLLANISGLFTGAMIRKQKR